jgi:FixJ family two-component response regulator
MRIKLNKEHTKLLLDIALPGLIQLEIQKKLEAEQKEKSLSKEEAK